MGRRRGDEARPLDSRAVRVMMEAGIDISKQRSKSLEAVAGIAFGCEITVCNDANESCAVFPGNVKQIHSAFDDPPRLAVGATCDEAALAPNRRVRDEMRASIARLPEIVEAAILGGDTR